MSKPIVAVTGNPRLESRTHGLARTLAAALAERLERGPVGDVDLAVVGAGVLDPDDERARAAVGQVLAAEIIVIASPTYKATYSGLLKAFLDRFGTGSLAGIVAIPILLGGSPSHTLAVDVHFTPLLSELGASVPARGLFVLESQVDAFPELARAWAAEHFPGSGAGGGAGRDE
jgi:FMN reductase